MLYPQLNATRHILTLDGFWEFVPDYNNDGEQKKWYIDLPVDREISVPASWNEQYQDLMHYFGVGWYAKSLILPKSLQGENLWLRIGAANYLTTVWVNGQLVGEHEGGHLPFKFNISPFIIYNEANTITIRVDAKIAADRLPPGDVEDEMIVGFKGQFPNNYYDFFPYGGINRPVIIYTTPTSYIESINIDTKLTDTTAEVSFSVLVEGDVDYCSVKINSAATLTESIIHLADGRYNGKLTIEEAILWEPDNPHLYEMVVTLFDHKQRVLDEYVQNFGVRTITIHGSSLILNGRPIFLRGFGMHEDFPILGKGMNHAVITKDFNLLKWTGANSIRTSHYPYSEEFLMYADRTGLLVIGETPFVGFVRSHYSNEAITHKAKRVITEMIHRDNNHPSIIAWSLANEGDTFVAEADSFYKQLYDHARTLDTSRPITIANSDDVEKDVALHHFDFISLNRYHGWYVQAAQLNIGCEVLSSKLDRCFEKYNKPIMITEFGADAVAGVHTDPPELFSEEYQAEMVTRQYEIIANKPYTIGAHVWSFADFKTSQTPSRVVVNRKGIFTRERQPKLAAHKLRELWRKHDQSSNT